MLQGPKFVIIFILLIYSLSTLGCLGPPKQPEEDLPEDPAAKAAILGLANTYRSTDMYETRNFDTIQVQPVVPTKGFVQEFDPRELYCVCIEFDKRYSVPWTTYDHGSWKRQVRNVLVMQKQRGHFVAMKPQGLCPSFCE